MNALFKKIKKKSGLSGKKTAKRCPAGYPGGNLRHIWLIRCVSLVLLCAFLAGCVPADGIDGQEKAENAAGSTKTETAAGSAGGSNKTEPAAGSAGSSNKTEPAAGSAGGSTKTENAAGSTKTETAAGSAGSSTIADASGAGARTSTASAADAAGAAAGASGMKTETGTASVIDTSAAQNASNAMTGTVQSGGMQSGTAGRQEETAGQQTEIAGRQTDPLTEEEMTEKMIREYLQTMSLEDKISGLFILTPEQLTGYGQVTEAGEATRDALEEWPVAGLVYFAGNIIDREQTEQMLASVKEWGSAYVTGASEAVQTAGTGDSASAETTDSAPDSASAEAAEEASGEEIKVSGTMIPPFLAVDEEGGRVARIGSSAIEVPYVGSMLSVGATGDPEAAYEAGSTIGAYLRELGFNLDLAPDADVLVDPENVTIGDRSFGSDPELCGQMVHRYVDGLHEYGIASCIKHFPGLGDTESDTHTGAAWSSRTIDDYRGTEFISFGGGIEAGTEMVMISHLSNSVLSGSDLPASLNQAVVTDILRKELGYEGLVITDSLRMGAVSERFSSAEAAVMALEAGVDLLLMPADFQSAHQGILEAVQSERISEERIDESLYRILRARAALGY